nr:MAG TPA: hypothetical protein [Caudoviricetes sp.]
MYVTISTRESQPNRNKIVIEIRPVPYENRNKIVIERRCLYVPFSMQNNNRSNLLCHRNTY